MSKRRTNPEGRREDLIAAAQKVFARKGVTRATVSDIVKAAGVAQGTFYLYFDAKTDVINALVEQMVDGMVNDVERAVTATGAGAVAKLLALRDALLGLADAPVGRELASAYHRPENRAVHERMAERVAPRLAPLLEAIVRQGVAEGVFTAPNPRVASWFVLGGLHMLEGAFSDETDLAAAISSATDCSLRALGCAGPMPAPPSRRRRRNAR